MSRERAVLADLPTGTVTFLFTDIEGSTKLLHELGAEAYGAALAEHRRLLRDAFARHSGVEVDTQGDAFFVAFPTAQGALDAAAEAHGALTAGPIRVRMGIHTGTPHLTAEGYVGQDVHLGARIAAAGHGGQVLLSKETRELVELEVTDLGEHRLKDFDAPVWIYQLGTERFPPLKTISNTNLPRPVSAFVGREKEVGEITALLRDGARLVTLTGPGGTGKTRLSIEAASELVPDFKNGTFWVDLAPLTDPALVSATIAQTIGAKDELATHIGQRELLLVLDNLEQVVAAGSDLARLVSACSNLRVLATSRERLHVKGETEYAVPPLAPHEAVELFASRSNLERDDTIAELCRRLDNLPLAVELAAARTSVLSPAQILDRLAKRLDLLKGGRDAEARQATLRATIEWSHELLDEDEKRLFARLSVFRGNSLEAAEEVVYADLDTLQSLVDKSLVRHTGERFWMLETIREYALEQLESSGEAADLRRRHAGHYLTLAENAAPHLEQYAPEWIERLESEHDNFRAAFDYLAALGEPGLAVSLAAALFNFWYDGGHAREARLRLAEALRVEDAPDNARARVMVASAFFAYGAGEIDEAKSLAQGALDLYRRLDDPGGAALALNVLVVSAIDEKDFDRAQKLAEDSVALFREAGDDANVVSSTRALAFTYHAAGDLERARAIHEHNLQQAREHGPRETEVGTLGSLSMIAGEQGRVEDAVELSRANVLAARDLGSLHQLAQALCRAAGVLALFLGKSEVAAALLACFEALGDRIGVSEAWVGVMNEETEAAIRSQLDPEAERQARDRGAKLTLDGAVELALAELMPT